MKWAAHHWDTVEVRCLSLGLGNPLRMGIRLFCNVAYVVFFETLPDPLFDTDGLRAKYAQYLAWDDEAEAMRLAQEDRITRDSAAIFGGGESIGDDAFGAAWEERQVALLEQERLRIEQAQREADEVAAQAAATSVTT